MDVISAAYTQMIDALCHYRQLLMEPTHNTESTLDPAFINHSGNQPDFGIFPTYFSDHPIVFLNLKMM